MTVARRRPVVLRDSGAEIPALETKDSFDVVVKPR